MAEWDYAYAVEGTPLSDYATHVRIPEEKRARKRGRNREIPWKQGERSTQPKLYSALEFQLQMLLRYTNAAGAVTHVDGEAGHVYENYLELKRVLSGDQINGSLVTLSRTMPHAGAVELDIEVLDEIGPDPSTRFRMIALCRAPFPFWRDATQSVFTAAFPGDGVLPITVGGNEPIPNAVVTIAADTQPVTNPRVGLASTGRFLQYNGTIAIGESVSIDVGERTLIHSVDGAKDAALAKGFADWLVLPRGSYNLDISSDAGTLDYDITVTFHDLWS